MSRAVELLEAAVLLAREAADVARARGLARVLQLGELEHGEPSDAQSCSQSAASYCPRSTIQPLTAEVLTAVASVTANLGDLRARSGSI